MSVVYERGRSFLFSLICVIYHVGPLLLSQVVSSVSFVGLRVFFSRSQVEETQTDSNTSFPSTLLKTPGIDDVVVDDVRLVPLWRRWT